MDIVSLNKRIEQGLPIYFEDIEVKVKCVHELLGLAEVKIWDSIINIDIIFLSDEPKTTIEKGIPLSMFVK